MLDRPRHAEILAEVRAAGAHVKMISDGDIVAGIQAALPGTGVDMLLGIGGSPEAVLTAAAIRCIGGRILCKAWPRDDAERDQAIADGVDLEKVYDTYDLVGGEDVFFSATGASTGDLLKGVRFGGRRRGDAIAGDALALRHRPLDRLHPRLLAAGQDPV